VIAITRPGEPLSATRHGVGVGTDDTPAISPPNPHKTQATTGPTTHKATAPITVQIKAAADMLRNFFVPSAGGAPVTWTA